MTNNIITKPGKNLVLNRAYKVTPDYSAPQQFKIGVSQATPVETDTDLTEPIPIDDGIINDDGSNTMTGSSGGDNSTDNTTTYKPGGGVTDNTAQNLIANDTNATKIWTISNLASAGINITDTKYVGIWHYIVDATALAKYKSSGTAYEVKLGSDTSNYYSLTVEAADLAVGWNWISSYPNTVAELSETGTVTGDIDTFIIEITTNNSTDEFIVGDAIYDLLRTFDDDDIRKDFVTTYPTFDETNITTTMRCFITANEANGFLLNVIGIENKDTSPIMTDIDKHTDESKADTDEIAYIIKNKIE